MAALTYSGTLVTISCWCGIRYAVPEELQAAAKRDKNLTTYCPLGHAGVSSVHEQRETARLERELARERAARDQAEADARHQEARANGYKGAATKARKRAAKGVCPAPGCKRSFVDVARHVATCHPEMTGPVVIDGDARSES